MGIDNVNDYYNTSLKNTRLVRFENKLFSFIKMDISERDVIASLFENEQLQRVINLAAQPGVRYSIENPSAYANSKLIGHFNILKSCRYNKLEHLVYTYSGSVSGLNEKTLFEIADPVDHTVSLYTTTKKSNELMSHLYSQLYNLPITGLRIFMAYGSWSRPHMEQFTI